MTPYGDTNLDSLFGSINAADPLNLGAAFTGLEGGDSSIGADAFSIGDTTFDPMLTDQLTGLPSGAEGFDPVTQTIGAPPLLEIGGGVLQLPEFPVVLAPQDFNVYDGTGATATEVGNVTTSENVTNLLGLTNTEFTVDTVTAASGAPIRKPPICRQWDPSTTSSTSATGSRTSTAPSRTPVAPAAPSPTPW